MTKSQFAKRAGIFTAIALVVALVVTLGVGLYTVRRPLPTTDGSIRLSDFAAPVTITRDERSVPTITAETDADLMRAQGYVHAQDRFFEMDYRRHVTSGRLAELVGDVPEAIQADKVIRTLGWRRVAEQEWKLISQESRDLLTAYADGVNTYLKGREASELGVEYTVLGLSAGTPDIENWDPIDSLAWLKAMAWDLKNNFEDELTRAHLYAALGDLDRVQQLFPDYPIQDNAPIVAGPNAPTAPAVTSPARLSGEHDAALGEYRDPTAGAAFASAKAAISAVPQLIGGGEGTGSNSFVISGAHTDTGEPILANDPHLGVSQPSVWHQVGLKCKQLSDSCTFDVSGFSFVGMPGVVIGHNHKIAWGLTNTGADVTDFFLERLSADGTAYQRGADEVPLTTRTEQIAVAGVDEPIELTVRETGHGPIVSDVLGLADVSALPVPAGSPSAGSNGYAVSLAWTALQPGATMDAVFAIDRATSAEEIAAAAAKFEVPAQNIVWASTDGDIGYVMPGKIPVRGTVSDAVVPADGTWPRPGWDAAYDWLDYLSGDQLPRVTNPEEGFVVAANQAIIAPGDHPFLGRDFDYGYRSQQLRGRISEDIAAGTPITTEMAEQYMLDDANPFAEKLLPAILRLDIEDPFIKEAIDELRTWQRDGLKQSADAPGAAYFASVWAHLVSGTFDDDLPDSIAISGGSRWLAVMTELIDDPQSSWWDDRTTINVRETRDEILTRALTNARYELTNVQGKEPGRWSWGDLHQFRPTHSLLGGADIPAPVRWLVNPTPVPASGGSSIVNATGWSPQLDKRGRGDYQVTTAPSMRMVVDLSDLDASSWVNLTGNSGHPASRHYTDQIEPWASGEYFPWPFSADAVAEAATQTLVIEPRE